MQGACRLFEPGESEQDCMSLGKQRGQTMSATQLSSSYEKYLRWLHEILFSLNAMLLILPVASVRIKYPVLILGRSLLNFLLSYVPLLISLLLKRIEPNRLYFTTLLVVTSLAFFAFLRVIGRFATATTLLRTVPGIAAVAGLPIALRFLQAWPPVLFTEVTVAVVCVLFFLYGNWKLPSMVSIFLLALHFGLWCWGAWKELWLWGFYPVVGFLSVVIWAIFVKRLDKGFRAPVTEAHLSS